MGHDASLGDGDGLLLHRLVDRRPVRVVHLVELVYEADALVGQDEGAGLQGPLLGQLRALGRAGVTT